MPADTTPRPGTPAGHEPGPPRRLSWPAAALLILALSLVLWLLIILVIA